LKAKGGKYTKRVIILSLLLPVQIFFIQFLKTKPEWIENYYSLGFYPWFSKVFQAITGILPFSIGDLLYILVILFLLNKLRLIILKRVRLRWPILLQLIAYASIVYFWFHLSWGFNYYRLPLHQQLEIKNDYSSEELARFTSQLLNKSNDIHYLITRNDTMPVIFKSTESQFRDLVFRNMDSIKFLNQEVGCQSIKPSLLSLPLSYMGFGGYLNPFTHEAQYNDKVPKYKYPSLIAHEMAHQIGYAKENEANFVSCYTNMHSKDLMLKYAGYTYALKFCLNELYFTSPEDFELLMAKLNPGILKNFKEINIFWESYKNPLEPLFKKFYGNFLKANNQPQGIKSYNYVVALLVNYYSEKSLP
jgi:hypothetical protein